MPRWRVTTCRPAGGATGHFLYSQIVDYDKYKLANCEILDIAGHRDIINALKEERQPVIAKEDGTAMIQTKNKAPEGP